MGIVSGAFPPRESDDVAGVGLGRGTVTGIGNSKGCISGFSRVARWTGEVDGGRKWQEWTHPPAAFEWEQGTGK